MIFLVQTPHAWRGIRQRPHHLMRRFAARGHTVHWIESRYVGWLAGRAGEFWRARRERPEPRLTVEPVTLLNGERWSWVRQFNRTRLARAFAAAAAAAPSGEPRVLWIYNPHEGHLARSVPADVVIYDVMDEYRGFPWSPPAIADEEAELLGRADWVFAGTRALEAAKRPLAPGRIECVLSGVEADRFAPGRPAPPDPDLDRLRERYRRLVGYAGMIDLRLDQDALATAARARPHWGFVLAGPVRGDARRLRAQPNIHLLGMRPYEALPSLYRAWDAALLPFVDHLLTRHVNPTKMLEYAAAERPIVARDLPEIAACYADGAWLYRTPEELIAALDEALEGDGETRARKLHAARRWVAEREWDALAERMLARVAALAAGA